MGLITFYKSLAFVFVITYVLYILLNTIGIFDDGDGDDGGDEAGFSILTLRNLVTFFTFFSLGGYISLSNGLGDALSIFLSFVSGISSCLVTMGMLYLLSLLKNDGTGRLEDTLGKGGEVYLSMEGKDLGKVNIIVNGSLQTVNCKSINGVALNRGDEVVVEEIRGTILMVSKK